LPSSARPALFALVSLLALAAPALAHVGGIVGFSDIGCVDCHDDEGIAKPSIAIVGPTTVEPGALVTYQVVVTRMAESQLGAGFNFAVSGGDVTSEDPGVRRSENREMRRFELTHNGPRENDANGQAAWSVIWVTPNTPGDYTLFAAGNSVNLNNLSSGDASNFTVLVVHVGGAQATPTPTVTPGGSCEGDCNGDGTVAINELITGVTIALGSTPVNTCASMDASGDGTVAINELIAAVGRALNGC
jgi:hypothetical protein